MKYLLKNVFSILKFLLLAGFFLILSGMLYADPLSGKLVSVKGSVMVYNGLSWVRARLNMPLKPGYKVRTISAGEAVIKLDGSGSLVVVKPNTVYGLDAGQVKGQSSSSLSKGSVMLKLSKLNKKKGFSLSTPTMVAGVRGTTLAVNVNGASTEIASADGNTPGSLNASSFSEDGLPVSEGVMDIKPGKGAVGSVSGMTEVDVPAGMRRELKKVSVMGVPLPLKLENPRSNTILYVYDYNVKLKGVCQDTSKKIDIYVNGDKFSSVRADFTGRFSSSLNLEKYARRREESHIVCEIEGYKTSSSVSFKPFPVTIASPSEGFSVNAPVVQVAGQAHKNGTLKINGQNISIDAKNSFKGKVRCNYGAVTLNLEYSDPFGDVFTKTLSGTVSSPSFRITTPAFIEGNADNIRIGGTGFPGAQVNVGGVSTTVGEDGTFQVEIPVREWGTKELTVSYSDGEKKGSSVVKVSRKPLPLTVTSPSSGQKITGSTVTVKGSGEPGASVTVAGVSTVVGSDGTFSLDVSAKSFGSADFAVDYNVPGYDAPSGGAQAPGALKVTLSPRPFQLPSVEGESGTGAPTEKDMIYLKGRGEDGGVVKINGKEVRCIGGTWGPVPVPLPEIGENEITVEYTDPLGQTTTTTRKILRKEPSPVIRSVSVENPGYVKGRSAGPAYLTVTVNGEEVISREKIDGSFRKDITDIYRDLDGEDADVVIVLENESGEKVSRSVSSEIDLTPPELDDPNYRFSGSFVVFTGNIGEQGKVVLSGTRVFTAYTDSAGNYTLKARIKDLPGLDLLMYAEDKSGNRSDKIDIDINLPPLPSK